MRKLFSRGNRGSLLFLSPFQAFSLVCCYRQKHLQAPNGAHHSSVWKLSLEVSADYTLLFSCGNYLFPQPEIIIQLYFIGCRGSPWQELGVRRWVGVSLVFQMVGWRYAYMGIWSSLICSKWKHFSILHFLFNAEFLFFFFFASFLTL